MTYSLRLRYSNNTLDKSRMSLTGTLRFGTVETDDYPETGHFLTLNFAGCLAINLWIRRRIQPR